MSEPVTVFVVDNGGQWTHRIWRVLREIGCETKIVSNATPGRLGLERRSAQNSLGVSEAW
jgi:GMP synthase-like glutamine amidotransferase